jgi:hypothetical protein
LEECQPLDGKGVRRDVNIFNRSVEAVAIWPALFFLASVERIADYASQP